MEFRNAYEDKTRAESYAKLKFPGTYYLAFRDLPELIAKHVTGDTALDFGCGAGRSTRFLQNLDFQTVGVDISSQMLELARQFDPAGEYLLVGDGDLARVHGRRFDLILLAFTFDNIKSRDAKIKLFSAFKQLLNAGGKVINLVSTPDIYLNEWLSFTTKDYPENRQAKDGDVVRIITTAVEDKRPVEDIIFSDKAYRDVYDQADLKLIQTHLPLGKANEPFAWVNETKIAPWAIYVLG